MFVDLLSLLHQAGLVSLLLHPAGLREQRRHHEAASSSQVREVYCVSVLLDSMVFVNSRCLNNSQFHSYRCALSTNWPRWDTGATWFQFFNFPCSLVSLASTMGKAAAQGTFWRERTCLCPAPIMALTHECLHKAPPRCTGNSVPTASRCQASRRYRCCRTSAHKPTKHELSRHKDPALQKTHLTKYFWSLV